jgi:hypothetical protein
MIVALMPPYILRDGAAPYTLTNPFCSIQNTVARIRPVARFINNRKFSRLKSKVKPLLNIIWELRHHQFECLTVRLGWTKGQCR